jgi:ribosome-binding factor A
MTTLKQDRMSDRIREILSDLLFNDVTDPALQNLTVTSVSLDAELEYANVYVNALGDESRQKEVMRGLERAKGYLRREVGARIRLRRTPVLVFHWDLSLEHADHIERIFSDLNKPASDNTASPTESVPPTTETR